MTILIDIENKAGLRYGEGPITTAVDWNAVRRLDAAGTFSFTMPASDPDSNLCQHKRIARCFTYENGVRKEVGAGVIDEVTLQPQANGPTLIRVAGDDLLRELVNIQVGDLELFDRETRAPNLLTLVPDEITLTLPVFVFLTKEEPLRYIYVKCDKTFNNVTFGIDPNWNSDGHGTLRAQFYNATTIAWENLSISDTTYGTGPNGGATFYQTGTVSWDMPDGWGTLDLPAPYYVVRLYSEETEIAAVLTYASVDFTKPTYDAVTKTMALAPAGWSLDLTGKQQTETPVYLQMAGETILATFGRIAEQTGEHFARSPAGRRVRWIGIEKDDSGLRAVAAGNQIGAQNPYALQIVSVEPSSESYGLCTRIYPYGAGIEGARLTMADVTDTAPAGYTLDKINNYLEHNAAAAEYGRIDWSQDFPDISPLDISESSVQYAANQLLKRAYEVLRRKAQINKAYTLTVLPTLYEVWPGQTIECVYHEWEDNFHVIDIDTPKAGTPLWVMETESQIDATGTRVIGLTVAAVDKLAESSSFMVANSLAQFTATRRLELPETGFTDNGMVAGGRQSVIASLSIKNGAIVGVHREPAMGDGTYNVSTVTFRSGVIVSVNGSGGNILPIIVPPPGP